MATPVEETPVDKTPEKEEEKKPAKDRKKPPGVMKGSTFAKAKAKAKAKSQPKGASPKSKANAKASPKPKAKGSPKSKAKAKAKASAKNKAKGTPKKKEEKGDKEEEKTSPTKKRPAAAKSTLREQTQKWKQAALAEEKPKEEEEEEDVEEEAEGEDETEEKKGTRDSGKARAFSRMVKKGAVPSMVKDMLAEIEKQDQPRAKKTALINALFKKTADGSFEMKTNSTEFETFKESFKKNTETDQVSGKRKAVFLYRVYHGNSEALEHAIQQGHVMEAVRKGVVYCYYPTWSVVAEKGVSSKEQVKGSTKLSAPEFNALSECFSKLARKKPTPELASSSGGREHLAIEDGPVESKGTSSKTAKVDFTAVQKILEEAKLALDRLEKDLFKLKSRVQKAEDSKLLQNLKDLVVQCTDTQKQISHTLVWNEAPPDSNVEWTPEGVNKWIFETATKTEALDEGCEQLKAVLKARNL